MSVIEYQYEEKTRRNSQYKWFHEILRLEERTDRYSKRLMRVEENSEVEIVWENEKERWRCITRRGTEQDSEK